MAQGHQAEVSRGVGSNAALTRSVAREENESDVWLEFPLPSLHPWAEDATLLVRGCQPQLVEEIPDGQEND